MILKNNLPKLLKTAFWQDLLDAVQEEILNIKIDKANALLRLFDVDYQVENQNVNQLIEICKTFGYNPDISLLRDKSDEEKCNYLKNEIDSIPFRKNKRTTYPIYKYIYDLILLKGETFLMYWNSNKLIRAFLPFESAYQVVAINVDNDTNSNTSGTYFLISSPVNTYYVWFNVDSSSINPNISQAIEIEIDIAAYEDADSIATKIQTALNATSEFNATVIGDLITVTNIELGIADEPEQATSIFNLYVETIGKEALGTLTEHDCTLPYNFLAQPNYESFLLVPLYLDYDPPLYLDSVYGSWFLDQNEARLSTCHMSNEFSCLSLFTKDATEYIITKEYLDYLLNAVLDNKQVTDFPHIGCSISLFTDNSTKFDNAHAEVVSHSIPLIKTNVILTDLADINTLASTVKYLKVGIGNYISELPGKFNSVTDFPLDLVERIFTIELEEETKIEGEDWFLAHDIIYGNFVNNIIIGTGDGTTKEFSTTLSYSPIKPYKVHIRYTSEGVIYDLYDSNGDGEIRGSYAQGTIDYVSKELDLLFEKEVELTEFFEDTIHIDSYTLQRYPVITSSISLVYTISGTSYTAVDDGLENIIGTGIVSGSINYDTGVVDITFSATASNIELLYRYTFESIPDNATDIIVDYKTTSDLNITEAGLFDEDDNLLCYANFPPAQLGSDEYHLGIQFLIKKSSF